MRFSRHLSGALVAGLALVGACHDETAPRPLSTEFDAPHAIEQVTPLTAVFSQPIFTSFNGALSFFETYFRSSAAVSASITPRRDVFGVGVTQTLLPATGIRANAVPVDVQGKTFVYDLASHSYVVDAN